MSKSEAFLTFQENKKEKHKKNWILFVGLSHKLGKNWEILEAFAASTLSGKVLSDTCFACWENVISRCNLVPGVPLDSSGKVRYPNQQEIKKWLNTLIKHIKETNPKLIFLFGKQVQNAINSSKLFSAFLDKKTCTAIHKEHPAYIVTYKKKDKQKYLDDILKHINNFFIL